MNDQNPDNAENEQRQEEGDPHHRMLMAMMRPQLVGRLLTPIFRLDRDCSHEIFNCLPFSDVYTVSQTCGRMQNFAAEYIQYTYKSAEIMCVWYGIMMEKYSRFPVNDASQFIQKVHICDNQDGPFSFIESNCSSLNRICIAGVELTDFRINCIRKLLKNVETLELFCVDIGDEFHENILRFCKNLKRLSLRDFFPKAAIIGTDNHWLHYAYPKLVHFELDLSNAWKIDELKEFFEQQKNLQCFATNVQLLRQNAEFLIESKKQLRDLAITGDEIVTVWDLLKDFHNQDIYKRLHLYVPNVNQPLIEQIGTLDGLETLYVVSGSSQLHFNSLTNLSELVIHSVPNEQYALEWTMDLVNLQRLSLQKADASHILPFVQYSDNLQMIKIKKFDQRVVNLPRWSAERLGIFAQKLTIYVEERCFLKTKWTFNGTCIGQVEVKRYDSCEWTHHFKYN